MAIHIQDLVSEVNVSTEDLPLSKKQLEILVATVLTRLREIDREQQALSDMTAVTVQARPPVRLRK